MALTLLNTRPKHQSEPLNQLLIENSIRVFDCPTMQISFCQPPAQILSKFADVTQFDAWVVTSINALAGLVCALPDWFDGLPSEQSVSSADILVSAHLKQPLPVAVYAIGHATAIAAEALGLQVVSLDRKQFDSEDLLQHLAQLRFSTPPLFALLTGKGGRQTLKEGLLAQGAQVIELEVYQRTAALLCAQSWERFIQSKYPVVLVSSLESWQFLQQRLRENYTEYQDAYSSAWSKMFGVVVFSERIRQILLKQGWPSEKLVVVPIQSNQGVLKALQKLSNSI